MNNKHPFANAQFRPPAKLLLIYFNLVSYQLLFLFPASAGIYTNEGDKRWNRKESITNICGEPSMYQELSHVL